MSVDSMGGFDNLEAFKNDFSVNLSQKAAASGKQVSKEKIKEMADEFVAALIDFKTKVALDKDEQSMTIVKGEVTWSPSRDKLINELSSRLEEIFKPIGGINPGEQAVFWSQQGRVQAQVAGQNLENTIAGFLLEKIGNELSTTFTPNAYK